MGKIEKTNYDLTNLKSFEEEWLLHKDCSDWWYSTGVLYDSQNNMYSFQFTFLRMRISQLVQPFILMLAITDFQTCKHYYNQKTAIFNSCIEINKNKIAWGNNGVTKDDTEMLITGFGSNFSFDLKAKYGKGAFWHCEKGKLQMAIPNEEETTYYYSYTNMPTSGTIQLDGKEIEVTGKTWFDKQGGTFNFLDIKTHWEWFSMRFNDDEEIMLFSFPQSNYIDGTYINRNGDVERVNNYQIKPLNFVDANGYKFSSGWELTIPGIKEVNYTILPVMQGQLNLAYYEQLCKILNKEKEEVGFCFVELLPGVYNTKIDSKLLTKKVV